MSAPPSGQVGGPTSGRAGGRWSGVSLRLRITLLATAVTLACLLGLATAAGRGLGPVLTGAVDDELRVALSTAAADVATGRAPDSPDGLEVRVLDTAGDAVGDGAGGPSGETAGGTAGDAPDLTRDQVRTLKAGTPVTAGDAQPVRWHGVVTTAPDGAQRLVVAGTGLVGQAAAKESGGRWLLLTALVGSLVAGVAIWFAVGSALAPVARMRESVRRLAPGARVAVPGGAAPELRELADDFNVLLDRQDATAERLRRFTGDAAHELRSPVASIRVQSEVAVASPDPRLSQEVHADVLADAERLSALLDGLLALARSDAGELPPAQSVDLVDAVRAAVDRTGAGNAAGNAADRAGAARPGDPAVPVPVVVNALTDRAWAAAAHTETELVLDNLLRNAGRYTRTRVVVSVLAQRSTVRVLVDDDGPGVPPEHRAHVFDRFYRVADDRARTSGGAGLGLALVAELVRRRGGEVAVGESPDGGARFTVVWPRAR
ncbi:sensor histidine kinase [Promicromonospora sukumoe]|uniref:histidine kinase n=1 Tax=Promicromonospora sukumoe TaxID=88382 RepID=A0A7W3JBE9_9MICO|nr:HAMP domain-containing sensor histidine kinase [Promicromonospora sukumoe]MBA8809717.1 signal transduction histidine kinase [Promicromonospora sukumoe]